MRTNLPTSPTSANVGPPGGAAPGRSVVVVAVLVALWCAGFAAVSIWFELTNHFDSGQYAADAAALSVANWFVVVLKLVGAAVAVLSVSRRRVAPRLLGVLLWACFATLTVYVAGSLVQAVVMLAGISGDAAQVDVGSVAYVLAFLLAATGFGILTISYSRRARLSTWVKVAGALGAPLVLGGVLVVLPAFLRAVGLLSSAG